MDNPPPVIVTTNPESVTPAQMDRASLVVHLRAETFRVLKFKSGMFDPLEELPLDHLRKLVFAAEREF